MKPSNKDFPVLNAIIQPGNADIIQSTLSQHHSIDTLDPSDTLQNPEVLEENRVSLSAKEAMIDAIISKHVIALKKELREVIE